jgi:3'(2'), 5'-bisphosphate nucleotidase
MPPHELAAALVAVERACLYLMDAYAHFQVIADAPADITTEADRGAQEIILKSLHDSFPGDALCAEEATPMLKDVPSTGPRIWIVDPIDGTRGFARKNGEFSVMVGFVSEGTLEVGIVAQPALGRLTYASRGHGCWRRDKNEPPQPCRVTAVERLENATLTQSRSKSGAAPSPLVAALAPAKIVETYSAGVKLALVARGEADIYLNDYTAFHDWDIAAGHLLVTEAGGRVTGMRGEELLYGLPGAWQRHGLVATNGLIHQTALVRLGPAVTAP